MISKKSADLIRTFENDPDDYVGKPEWPGKQSGVTIGFGWDLGHTEWKATANAWKKLNPNDLSALLAVSGFKGEQASDRLASVSHIHIPYEVASEVFFEVTVPTWTLKTLRIYPQAEALPEDCLGALVSLVFNRGTDLEGERRTEMKEIQYALLSNDYQKIPNLIRSMKRLWPDVKGLRRRRDAEADLFEQALALNGE